MRAFFSRVPKHVVWAWLRRVVRVSYWVMTRETIFSASFGSGQTPWRRSSLTIALARGWIRVFFIRVGLSKADFTINPRQGNS